MRYILELILRTHLNSVRDKRQLKNSPLESLPTHVFALLCRVLRCKLDSWARGFIIWAYTIEATSHA